MSERAPLGLKILVAFNVGGTLLGMFGVLAIEAGGTGSSAAVGILVPVVLVISVLNLGLMFGLLKMNSIAHQITVALYTLSFIINLLSLSVIPAFVGLVCLIYLVSIKDKF